MIPASVMDELLTLVHVEFSPTGHLTYLQFPSTRQLLAQFSVLGGKNLPHSVDEVALELENRFWAVLPKWRAAHCAPKKLIIQREAKPELAKFYKAETPASEWEAKIKSAKLGTLIEICRVNSIAFDIHPSNNGLSSMRARNQLYAALRRGQVLK